MNSKSPASPKNPAFNIRRFVLTLVLVTVVGGIVAIIALGKNGAGIGAAPAATATVAEQPKPATPAGTQAPTASEPTAANAPAAPATPASDERPWTANAPGSPSASATAIGSVDPKAARFALVLVPQGAGINEIIFSDLWRSAGDAERARAGAPTPEGRYSIVTPGTLAGFTVPLLGVRCIDIDGRKIDVSGGVWKETAPGTFVTEISDGTGALQMRATRRWVVDAGSYDIRCEQRVENLSGSPHVVRWVQFGPVDLRRDQNDSVDGRRFQSGYLMSPERDPAQETVIVHGATLDHSKLLTQITAENYDVWPDAHQLAEKYGLSWFGATNRYFALAIHAPYAQPSSPSKAIAPAVASIQAQAGDGMDHDKPEQVVFTTCTSGAVTIAPGASASFDMGVFAGPLERSLLGNSQPFAALNMHGLILYLMSGCCSFCTFSWLADFLVWFLSFLHDHVVFDWGLAIIVLVIVVRSILHPLTRRAQISMQRVTKQMATVKPELEALQKRYKDDPKKLQEETIRLYRERGINPLGCAGGMVPTFLQMPIWIALYAVLYFAFELRQQPAFFGVFQKMGGWPFLGDLSAQDRFIPLPTEINLWIIHLSAINLIPVLMGVVFFIQQKYQAPPPTANMTPEQLQQQKMMKWMMVFLFPIMLYSAPSGLTLYIATSTLVGIYESMRVRKEIEKMDFSKPQAPKDNWLSKAYATAMKRAQAAQQGGKQAPSKKFRDR